MVTCLVCFTEGPQALTVRTYWGGWLPLLRDHQGQWPEASRQGL